MSNPEAPVGLATPVEPRSERMKNSDFRKMLATPRAGESSSVYSSKFATPRKRTDSEAGLNEREKKKKSASAYWKKKKQEKEEEDSNKTVYRDRAQERRLGKNIDYEEAERELIAGLSTGKADQSERGGVPNPSASIRGGPEGEKTTEGYLRNLSIEQSKYLGGDEKHTHLVKGLDYALLAKMKSEMALAEENQKKVEKEKAAKTKGGEVEFQSSCARGIYDALFQKHQKQNSNRFLLGKTTFLFNTSLDRTSAPPMTVIQSVEEGGAEFDDDYFHSPVSQKILEQLKKISTYSKLGEGGKGRKRERGGKGAERGKGKNDEEKRREEEEAKRREKEKEEERRRLKEESIFGDIGKYVCKIPERGREKETKEEKPKEKRAYFDDSTFGVMDGEGEEEKGGKGEEEREEEGEERDGEEDMKIDTDGVEESIK